MALLTTGLNLVLTSATTLAGSYTSLGTVLSISKEPRKTTNVDISALSDVTEQTQPGTIEPGGLTVELAWDKTVWTTLKGYQDGQTIIFLKLQYGSASTAGLETMSVFIDELNTVKLGRNEEVAISVKFKKSGATDTYATT